MNMKAESVDKKTDNEIEQERLEAEKLREVYCRKMTTRYYNNPHELFMRDSKTWGEYVELLDDFVYPVKIGKFDCYMSKYGRVWVKHGEDFQRVKPIVTAKKEYITLIDENHQRYFFVWTYIAKVLNTLRTRLNKEKINYE